MRAAWLDINALPIELGRSQSHLLLMYVEAAFLTAFGSLFARTVALDNGFGRTPPMGYNTYNAAGCTINQTFVRESIQAFSDKEFGTFGYKIFGIDCGWQGKQRQANGSITYDADGFPDGISPLSNLANTKGFVRHHVETIQIPTNASS